MNTMFKTALPLAVAGFASQALASPPGSDFGRYIDFNWGDCPEVFQSADNKNQCSLAEVPANWNDPAGQKIDVLVSKHPANSGKAKGQLWLLQGGPGGSGAVFPSLYDSLLKQFAEDYDLYVLEHRGVGWSTSIICPQVPADSYKEFTTICHDTLYDEWGENLYNFNTTNAAKDLDYVIGKSKAINWYPSYVYGVSYGTLWAQRFSQVAPTGAQAVILDSVVPPTGFGVDLWDENSNGIFDKVAEYCDSDPFCQSKLGNNTAQLVKDTVADFYSGQHCPEVKLTKDQLQELGMTFIQRSQEEMLMPIYHRLARCNADDVTALNNVQKFFFGGYDGFMASRFEDAKPSFSDAVFNVIAFNEISGARKSTAEKIAYCDTAVTCSSTERHLNTEADYKVWGDKYVDPYIYKDMFHYMPTLAINGDLDPQTPHFHAERIKGAFSNINQRYVEFPFTAHAAAFVTPAKTTTGNTCGVDVMFSFVNRLWDQPDTSCIDKLVGMNFDLPDFYSQIIFGTTGDFDEYDSPTVDLTSFQVEALSTTDNLKFEKLVKQVSASLHFVGKPMMH
ncbi:alpha/beta fold hydrolase [Veronia pacifica]|uniref:AB hydrolase-1 domain-containing protein n=1 Tax=Veronia pacifica TaxID=1080227 RepID=A0A1C3ELC3_9GAMM|nr:alpha/beta fold hydrolase [Veronia pacifica]ODA34043.1 hypothetical protein A8L45_08340 [Veronia pacifica]